MFTEFSLSRSSAEYLQDGLKLLEFDWFIGGFCKLIFAFLLNADTVQFPHHHLTGGTYLIFLSYPAQKTTGLTTSGCEDLSLLRPMDPSMRRPRGTR